MTTSAVEVEHLSKKYILSHQLETHGHYVALRDVITVSTARAAKRLLGSLGLASKAAEDPTREEFWALADVSLELKQGDRLGIIGRNGAGKSTLLKILSRITEPTSGRVKIRGRVASLLEVGTGFHPELTGRENIFLNGAILGMSRQEIKQKFDAIVSFAETEKFLDTPVKRYSSGMYVRLAFAVAAHLEPEILIVDEVLAVGDAKFQKKCLGKMEQVGKEGRTILFVSHNMSAIEQLCDLCLLLEKGSVAHYGKDVRAIVKQYLSGQFYSDNSNEWLNPGKDLQNPWFMPLRVYVGDQSGKRQANPQRNDMDTWLHIEGVTEKLDYRLAFGYAIYDQDNTLLYISSSHDETEDRLKDLKVGRCVIRTKIPKRFLNEGEYRIAVAIFLHGHQWICHWQNPASPAVSLIIQGGLSDSANWTTRRPGLFAPVMSWQLHQD